MYAVLVLLFVSLSKYLVKMKLINKTILNYNNVPHNLFVFFHEIQAEKTPNFSTQFELSGLKKKCFQFSKILSVFTNSANFRVRKMCVNNEMLNWKYVVTVITIYYSA